MFKQLRASLSGFVCGLALGAMLYAGASQTMPRFHRAQASHPNSRLQKLKQNIARLERELADQKDKLVALSPIYTPVQIPHPPASELAITTSITGTSAIVDRGSKAGFRLSDKLAFVRHTEAGFVIDGLGDVSQLNDKDLLAIQSPDFCGIRPDDEVYIVNRDNSKYSLAKALLWCDSLK